jgi:hypothetical protein
MSSKGAQKIPSSLIMSLQIQRAGVNEIWPLVQTKIQLEVYFPDYLDKKLPEKIPLHFPYNLEVSGVQDLD